MTILDRGKPGCLAAFLNLFRRETTRVHFDREVPTYEPAPREELPYRLRDDFLSRAELAYYCALKSVLGPRATLCMKVRLADILYVSRPNENAGFFNRIAQKHVDFLLCDSTTMRPVVAIELDDASHGRADRQERDAFVDGALEAAGLPLVRIAAQWEYSKEDIIATLAPILREASSTAHMAEVPGTTETAVKPSTSPPVCPTCGIPMVLRTARKGAQRGTQFFGCRNFPRCRQVVPLPALEAAA